MKIFIFVVILVFCLGAEARGEQWRRVTGEEEDEFGWEEEEEELPAGSGWRRITEEEKSKVEFSEDATQIVVGALINNQLEASLILDTGANVVFLSKAICEKLGIDTSVTEEEIAKAQIADGSELDVKHITLDSVIVEGLEAKDVAAVVVLDEEANVPKDGLLGMSFLENFKFEIDYQNKKLSFTKE